jgi:hypothetical protein
MRTSLLAPSLALTALIFAPVAPAEAADRICRGAIGAVRVDNVRVPEGATCTLNGTLVRGNITVQRRATLVATRVIVIGNVQGSGAQNVSVLDESRIGGSIQVQQGGGATVDDTRIDGHVSYDSNRAPVALLDSAIDGNVQADKNTGGVEISGNTIGGNLQCRDNNPAPTGGDNVVDGDKQDQCRRL